MRSGIYKIYCTKNRKIYIGSSCDIPTRWTHRNTLRKQIHHCKHLQNTWNKYGENSFEFSVIEYTTDLVIQEQIWLNFFENTNLLFNASLIAGQPLGWHGPHSDETKKKISVSHTGKSKSPEHRAKLAFSMMGNKNALGSRYSPEISAKLSQLRKGRILSESTKQKISVACKGKPKSEKTRQKMSAAALGKIISEKTRQKMSVSAKNRKSKI